MVTRRAEPEGPVVQALRPEDMALPWLEEPLQQVLAQHRGHALLVCGTAGAGALEFLLRLSQAWLCEDRAAPSGPACGQCGSCRLFLSHAHPDFRLRVPEALAVARDIPVLLDERRKPSRQIRIDEIRQAMDWMTTTTGRGQGKVLALHPAEAMNAASASALLKTLEEPPAGSRVVLSTADPGLLMPTIRSRCQMVRLPPPPRTQALAWLERRGVDDAGVLLDGAGGMPLAALQWSAEGLSAATWRALPQAVAAGDAGLLLGWPIPRVLDALQKICHDAGCHIAGGRGRFFPENKWPPGASLQRLVHWHKSLQRVMTHAEHPWSEALLIESLVAQGRSVWNPEPERRGGRLGTA
jgi:DNA polymerase III subunit delta'